MARGAQRDDDAASTSTAIATSMTANTYQRVVGSTPFAGEAPDRLDDDDDAAREQDGRLAERRQVLRAPVPVGVLDVGRPAAEPDREEREERRDDVAAGLDARGDQPEAVGEQARARA